MSPGEIEIVRLASRAEGTTRTLRIYRPAGAALEDARVVVMHDGQNLFSRAFAGDHGSWDVDRSLDAAHAGEALPPIVVVGVDHRGADRIGDLSPWRDPRVPFEPRATRYAAFLVEELLPWITSSLGARPRSALALAGSSLGGLATLFVASAYPGAFGGVAALSPTVMWASRRVFVAFSRRPADPPRLWLDAGARERFDAGAFSLDYGGEVAAFARHLRASGWEGPDLHVELDPHGGHDETSWGRRFPAAMRFLFGAAPAAEGRRA